MLRTLVAALAQLWRPAPPRFADRAAVRLDLAGAASAPLVIGSYDGAPVGLRGCDVIVRRDDPLLWRIVEWNARSRAKPPAVLVLGTPGCAADLALGSAQAGETACGLDFRRSASILPVSDAPYVPAQLFAEAFCPDPGSGDKFWTSKARQVIVGLFAWSTGRMPLREMPGLAGSGLLEPLTGHQRARLLREGIEPVGARLIDALCADNPHDNASGARACLHLLRQIPEITARSILATVADALGGLSSPAGDALERTRPCLLDALEENAGGRIVAVRPDTLPAALAPGVLRYARAWAWHSRGIAGAPADSLPAPLLLVDDWRSPGGGATTARDPARGYQIGAAHRGCRILVIDPGTDPQALVARDVGAVVLKSIKDGTVVQLRHEPRPYTHTDGGVRCASGVRLEPEGVTWHGAPEARRVELVHLAPPWRCRPGSV